MKLHYTYEMGATNMIYELDDVVGFGGYNLKSPHVFPTQKEADFFAAYALMKGIAVETYSRRSMPKTMPKDVLVLWATIPHL